MNYKPDIIIRSKNNELIATVEIKNRKNFTREIAIDFRRNIIAHGLTQQYHYFLIISQDIGFLWSNKDNQELNSPPDKEFSMKSIIKKHTISHGKNVRFRESELELIIFQWLNDLTFKQKDYNQKTEKSLYDTGFIQDIQDATIELENDKIIFSPKQKSGPEFINYLKSNATSNVSLKQVRKELSVIKGSLSEEIIKDREKKL